MDRNCSSHPAGGRRRARLDRPWPLLGAALVLLAATPASSVPVGTAGETAIVHVHRPASDTETSRSIDLEMGKSTFLRTDFRVKRVSVGDPGILEVNVLSPREIQLVPVKPGATNVVLWDAQGVPILVMDTEVGSRFSPIERRIRSVLSASDVRVEPAGNGVVLRGSVPSPLDVDRAMAIARAYLGGKDGETPVVNALEVGGPQQVMIEVIIAEMQRSLGRDLTVNWSTAIKAGGYLFAFQSLLGGLAAFDKHQTSLDTGSLVNDLNLTDRVDFAGTVIKKQDFLLDLFVEAAQSRGLAKVLAKPTLIARSGESASFLAGGEIPIPVVQSGSFGAITIEYKKFGVGVQFTPTVLDPKRIHLVVSPEVSQPDFALATATGGIVTPGFVTRRASTSVDLGDGQSFAIAGLLSDQVNEFVEKYPVLGDIPILGTLFRSTSFKRNETELVLIVTPRIVKPIPPDQVRLPTDSFAEPNDFELYLLGALEAQCGRGHGDSEHDTGGLIGPAGHVLSGDLEEETQ
jgi:pilus assembly protein CpaC